MALTREERKRLRELLAGSELTFRMTIERFITRVQSEPVMGAILEALERGNQSAALSIVQEHVEAMGASVSEVFVDVGRQTADELTAQAVSTGAVGRGAGGGALGGFTPHAAIAFDPTYPRAAELMRRETLTFVQQLTDAQIESTREAIAISFEQGLGTDQTVRAIRQSIGLTQYQARIVGNYERQLRIGSSAALDRQLRDRRYDRSVARAAEKPLTDAQINRMVDAYRRRFVDFRSETIARTEATRVTSLAREEAYRQTADRLNIGHNRIIRIWNATEDSRTRDWHESMDGQEAAIGQDFVDGKGNRLMYPGDSKAPPETIINCRCALTMRIADD